MHTNSFFIFPGCPIGQARKIITHDLFDVFVGQRNASERQGHRLAQGARAKSNPMTIDPAGVNFFIVPDWLSLQSGTIKI